MKASIVLRQMTRQVSTIKEKRNNSDKRYTTDLL
jgi:hypothetical protein